MCLVAFLCLFISIFLAFYYKFKEQLREWFHEQEKHEKRVRQSYRVEEELYKVLSTYLEEYLPNGIVWCPVKRKSQGTMYRYFSLAGSLKNCKPNAIKKNPLLFKSALEMVSTIVVRDLPFTSLPLDKVGRVSEDGSLVLCPGSAIKIGNQTNISEMSKTLEPFVEHSKGIDEAFLKFGLELKRLLALDQVDDAKALIIAQVQEPEEPVPDLCAIENWHQMRLALTTNEAYKDRVGLEDGKIVFHDIEDNDPVLVKARALWQAYEWKMDIVNMPLFPDLVEEPAPFPFEPEPGQTRAEAFGEEDSSEAPEMPQELDEYVPQRETLRLGDGIEIVMTPQLREAVWNAMSNNKPLTFDLPQEAKSMFRVVHQTATKTIFSITRGIMLPCDPDEELDWSIPEDADVMKRIPQSLERSDSPKRARVDDE